MRKIYILCWLMLVASTLFAQVPQTIDNQAITNENFQKICPADTKYVIDSIVKIPGTNTASLLANINLHDEPMKNLGSGSKTTDQQIIVAPQGWSGLSSFVVPDNPDIENLFSPLQDNLIILYNLQGTYSPSQGVNTLGNWDSQSGYVAKFNQETNFELSGQLIENGMLSLNSGWNLIPVLSTCPVSVEAFFANQEVTVVREVAGWKLFWPEMGINTLDSLSPGKAYFVKMNSPAEVTFPNCSPTSWHCGVFVVDTRDGKTYGTVQIGEQCWMQENLNYATGNSWCYANSSLNCSTYGRLYDWNTALTACPSGWHLPGDAEWTNLTNYLGGSSVAGGKMKEAGTAHWYPPNAGATNSSGFTGFPGGLRLNYGTFNDIGNYGFWWSSSEYNTNYAWNRGLYYYGALIGRYYYSKSYGCSVRCLRD